MGTANTPRWRKELATKMHTMHKKKKLQERESCWAGGMLRCPLWTSVDTDTRINSRIRVSADPPDRQMPSAQHVSSLKILCFLCIFVIIIRICVNRRQSRFLSLLCVSALCETSVYPVSSTLSSWRLGSPTVAPCALCLWLKIHRNRILVNQTKRIKLWLRSHCP